MKRIRICSKSNLDRNHIKIKHRLTAACLIWLVTFWCTGCAQINKETKVVLTTGFSKDEVFRIEKTSCFKPEVMVYLTNIQNQYENVYGEQIWTTSSDGMTLEENVKETVLAELAQIKTMNLMADQYGVTLSQQESAQIEEAAESYFNSLNDTEKELMGVQKDDISMLYQEYALADKVYQHIISEVNPEISDDEARIIVVEEIFVSGTGSDAYAKAREALIQAQTGVEFETLIGQYSEGQQVEFSFGKGEMDEAYETAAFNLGNGEISDIIETEEGYHIIKCLSTFNREETDMNKEKIVEQRRQEIFSEEYDTFVQSLTRNVNDKLWESISFIHDERVKTSDFFDVYSQFTKN